MKKNICGILIFIAMMILFVSCEEKFMNYYSIKNSTTLPIKIYHNRASKTLNEFALLPNEKIRAFKSSGFGENDVPIMTDTLIVEFNDSIFYDTFDLKRNILNTHVYKLDDVVKKGNSTTSNYVFVVDDEYINILRNQIKRE
jgi:hypothetical protein